MTPLTIGVILLAIVLTVTVVAWAVWEYLTAPLIPEWHSWSDEMRSGGQIVYTGFRGGSRMDGPLLHEAGLDKNWKAPDFLPEDWQ
jgi:hypothetical protein